MRTLVHLRRFVRDNAENLIILAYVIIWAMSIYLIIE